MAATPAKPQASSTKLPVIIQTPPPVMPPLTAAKPAIAPPVKIDKNEPEPVKPIAIDKIAPAAAARPETAANTTPPEEKPAHKRPARKPAIDDNEFTLGLEMPSDNFAQIAPDDSAPAVSADGLTRLLVTAYIGIGNKLFVRGEGPGLSWDRGIPLQFVSIGKWRWESAEATGPVTLKLYKNDEHEWPSAGPLTLAPGHQREVTANFN
jgi:hypothetical protein